MCSCVAVFLCSHVLSTVAPAWRCYHQVFSVCFLASSIFLLAAAALVRHFRIFFDKKTAYDLKTTSWFCKSNKIEHRIFDLDL